MQQNVTPLHRTQDVRINTFGAYLRFLRDREGISQLEMSESIADYFEDPAFLVTPDMYKKMERGKRAPKFEELLPLYQALLGNGFQLSLQETKNFVRLARLKIERLERKKPRLRPDGEWRLLEIQLIQLSKNGQEPEAGTIQTRAGRFAYDVSHVVGREKQLEKLLSYAGMGKKLVAIQGMMGVGKTSLLKLLLQEFLADSKYYPIMYTFNSIKEDITPSDHLRSFLATILTELQSSDAEAAETLPIESQINQLMRRLKEVKQRVVLLVDDGQVVLDQYGQISDEWQQFLRAYLSADHQALIYWSAREWPLWVGRERSYLVDGDEAILPPLEASAGVAIWQHLGFIDVPETLLEQATKRCGGNPLMIELRSASLKRPRFSIWKSERKAQKASTPATSEHQQLIEQLLAKTQIFTSIDSEVSQLLQQVISRRLSHDAFQILELLSISAIALPFPLLAEINAQAEYAFGELLRNSLIDREAIANERAALLPFVQEAGMHLLRERRTGIEDQLRDLYEIWFTAPDFLDDQEQSALVTELLVLYIKQKKLLQAAELLITHGWLCTVFGQIPRLRRLYETGSAPNRADPEEEAGAILLRWQFAQRSGEKIDENQQYEAYQRVFALAHEKQIQLQSATVVHLAHHRMLKPMREKQFIQAFRILEEAEEHITQRGARTEERASLLSSKGRLLARWGEHEENNSLAEGAHLRAECVVTLSASISLWRESQIGASPLQERYISFKLARTLNDYAYRLRLSGLLDQAEQAITECLELKGKGIATPKSYAVSLSEFSQILLARGKIREALQANDRALSILDQLIAENNMAARADKGMVLVERGDILLQQARLEEATNCFVQGRDLTGERAARRAYHNLANKRLAWVCEQKQRYLHRYQPDRQLFADYEELVSYDDLDWLVQSGPLNLAEQKELSALMEQTNDATAHDRISQIILQSREREFALAELEDREPVLSYPKIPQEQVHRLISGFEHLNASLEEREPNVVRRRLYRDVIEENLARLRLFKAIAEQDVDGVQRYNTLLYGRPTAEEMQIALQVVFSTLEEAREHTLAAPFATQLKQDLKRWGLHPGDFLQNGLALPQDHFTLATQPLQDRKTFSAQTLQRYFQHVFETHFPQSDMRVRVDPARGNVSIDVNVGVLVLADRPYSTEKARQLLAEEIETHFFRSETGRLSSLALLASGCARYSGTEEGIAKRYVELINAQLYGKLPKNTWPGTLATGLMAGVVTPALTFRKLCAFLEKLFLIRNLLAGKFEEVPAAQKAAKQEARKRATRTARTVTDLSIPRMCSYKDRIYLDGYLKVWRFLEKGGDQEQLYVGKMGVEQVNDMQDLHILRSALTHPHLAFDPHLEEYITEFEKE